MLASTHLVQQGDVFATMLTDRGAGMDPRVIVQPRKGRAIRELADAEFLHL